MAYAYSEMLEAGLAIVGKNRVSATEVEAMQVVGDVHGRTCILVDDMTTTAGTLCAAAALLKEQGAESIYAAVTHGILTQQAVERLQNSCICELITTDTIPRKELHGFPITTLSVAELLGQAIMRIHHNQSVTSLFQV
jgi:ribose-phosphate pyrophosphokinase